MTPTGSMLSATTDLIRISVETAMAFVRTGHPDQALRDLASVRERLLQLAIDLQEVRR